MHAQPVTSEELVQAQPQISYWKETRQPLYSLALVLPFVVIYQAGLVLTKSDYINGADHIFRSKLGHLLPQMGLQASWMSVLILGTYLLVEQFRKKAPWRIDMQALFTAFFECLIWGVALYMLLSFTAPYLPKNSISAPAQTAHVDSRIVSTSASERQVSSLAPQPAARRDTPRKEMKDAAPSSPQLQDFVLYCGAGVYEELVFRVFLFGLLMMVFRHLFHMESAYAAVWSVVMAALIFSAFHHIGGEAFTWSRFLQRVVAGLFFAAIYVTRSFGVAAGSHSLYDIVVGLNYCI